MAIEIRSIPVLEGEAAKRFLGMIEIDPSAEYEPPVTKEDIEAVRNTQRRSRGFKFNPKPDAKSDE